MPLCGGIGHAHLILCARTGSNATTRSLPLLADQWRHHRSTRRWGDRLRWWCRLVVAAHPGRTEPLLTQRQPPPRRKEARSAESCLVLPSWPGPSLQDHLDHCDLGHPGAVPKQGAKCQKSNRHACTTCTMPRSDGNGALYTAVCATKAAPRSHAELSDLTATGSRLGPPASGGRGSAAAAEVARRAKSSIL